MKFSHEWIEKNPWLLIALVTLVISVGGAVEIAAITKHEGFRWVQRKEVYPPNLNQGC